MKKTTTFWIVILLLAITASAQERRPVAVSPGSEMGIARVGVSCPTFSWTGMEWATGYRVVVFETNGPNILDYKEIVAIASPVLTKEIKGRALSWTPSSEERLSNGSMYVWYIQAVDSYGQGIWSEGRMFRVEAEVQLVGMEDSVRDSLREKGMSEEAIEDVLEDMRLGIKEVVAVGVEIESSKTGSQDMIGVQGTEGTDNTLYGLYAGWKIDGGKYNSFFGSTAGYENTSGSYNTFIGFDAGRNNTTGYYNTFIGYRAGNNNTGNFNTFLGMNAGLSNTTGIQNTFIGYRAGNNNTTGNFNTVIGYRAGSNNTTGHYNVFLGYQVGYNETGSYRLYIDNTGTSTPLIYGEFDNDILAINGKLGVGTKSPAYNMEIETTGENAILLLDRTDGAKTGFSASGDKCAFGTLTNHPLWMVINGTFKAIFHTDGSLQMMNGAWCTAAGKWQDASSRELKENIHSLTAEEAKEALDGLDPVRFNYKADKEDESLGFIPEDLPELVASKDRKSMSAMDVVAVLTKVVQEQQKILKEHQKRDEEQQNTIADLQKQIDELKTGEK